MIIDRLRQLIERVAPLPLCEACLVERLDGVPADEVHVSLNELAVEGGFDRLRGVCALCGGDHPAVQKRS